MTQAEVSPNPERRRHQATVIRFEQAGRQRFAAYCLCHEWASPAFDDPVEACAATLDHGRLVDRPPPPETERE